MRILAIMLVMLSFTYVEKAEAQRCKDPRVCGNRGGNNGGVIRDRRDLGDNRHDRDRNRDRRYDRDRRNDRDRDVRPVPRRDRDRDVRHDRDRRYDRDRDVRPIPRRGGSWDRDRSSRMHRRLRHRPRWNTPNYVYRRYTHSPYRYDSYRSYTRYYTLGDYFRTLPYRYIYWNHWVRYRSTMNDGFQWHNGYPYYVYNGYQHRYSDNDRCNYELVDGYNNTTVRSYASSYSCKSSYDRCANDRDSYNYSTHDYRYFCSERLDRDYGYDSNYNYDDDFYSDIYDDTYYY